VRERSGEGRGQRSEGREVARGGARGVKLRGEGPEE